MSHVVRSSTKVVLNQFKVLGTVYNGLLDVTKQKPNIETIGFSALTKDKSRTKVYTTLMDKLGRKS